ncbi:MAG: YbjQ family protein [Candidatus Paceibacterota bacterium]
MITTTTETIAGKRIVKHLGMVRGNTVRARHIGSDIGAGLKSLVGGKIGGYIKVMTQARDEATDEMLKDAERLGADAVVNIRYATSQVMPQAAEILAYGTAVKLAAEE